MRAAKIELIVVLLVVAFGLAQAVNAGTGDAKDVAKETSTSKDHYGQSLQEKTSEHGLGDLANKTRNQGLGNVQFRGFFSPKEKVNGWIVGFGPYFEFPTNSGPDGRFGSDNWSEGDSDNQWTIPIGGGGGKVFHVGKQAVNASVRAFHNLESPRSGSDWQLQFQIQFLFP